MLTEQEKQELETMRKHLAQAATDDEKDSTKDFWWQPACVVRLMGLERKDAIESAASFLDKRAAELDACGNLTSASFGRIYRDEASAIRKLISPVTGADFEDEPTKDQIPNLRTCGVARARPEPKTEPEWRAALEKAINENLFENPELYATLDNYSQYIVSGMVRCGTKLFWQYPRAPELVIALWPLEQLRRVVLSGKGEATVPESVAIACRDLYPEDGRWVAWSHDENLMRFVHGPSNGNCSVLKKAVLRAIDITGLEAIQA